MGAPGRQSRQRKLSVAAQRAQLIGSLRSQVSLLAVRANARLISRVESYVGQGAAEAARRGQQAVALERQEARNRRALALSFSQGQSLILRDCFRLA